MKIFDKAKPQVENLKKVNKSVPVIYSMFLGELCCLVTTALGMYGVAKATNIDTDDSTKFIGEMAGVAIGSLVASIFSCCVLPRFICPTVKVSIDPKEIEMKVKEILLQTLRSQGEEIDDAEWNHYFTQAKEALKQPENESLKTDSNKLINQEAVDELVKKLSESVLNNESTPLLTSNV